MVLTIKKYIDLLTITSGLVKKNVELAGLLDCVQHATFLQMAMGSIMGTRQKIVS